MSKEKINTVLKYNQDGRITIPMELRRALKLENISEFWLSVENDNMTLKPIREKCVLCGSEEHTRKIGDYVLCKNCYNEIVKQINEECNE